MNDIAKNLLDTDLSHCDIHTAAKIVKEYDKAVYKFMDENEGIHEEFLAAEHEADYSLSEFLWYSYWEELICFLRQQSD